MSTRTHRINIRLSDTEMEHVTAIKTKFKPGWRELDNTEAIRIALRECTKGFPVQDTMNLKSPRPGNGHPKAPNRPRPQTARK
jgi:hypothetical protein